MKLSEIKQILQTAQTVSFRLQDGTLIPEYFHITEIGAITKHFIDCGGRLRQEKLINFQLWDANDFEHRLKPGKLQNIIALSEKLLNLDDLEIEVEYQLATIGKYGLDFDGSSFLLLAKKTACLAQENCGMPKQKRQMSDFQTPCCTPNGNCC